MDEMWWDMEVYGGMWKDMGWIWRDMGGVWGGGIGKVWGDVEGYEGHMQKIWGIIWKIHGGNMEKIWG